MDDDVIKMMVTGIVGMLVLVGVIFLSPAVFAVAGVYAVYRGYHWYQELPSVRMEKLVRRVHDAYQSALAQKQQHLSRDEFVDGIIQQLVSLRLSVEVATPLMKCAADLYEAEGFDEEISPPPQNVGEIELARYLDQLNRLAARLANPTSSKIARKTILSAITQFAELLPRGSQGLFDVRVFDIVPAGDSIMTLILPFYSSEVFEARLFETLQDQLNRNQHYMSGVPFTPDNSGSSKLIQPTDHDALPEELVSGYLRNTPLLEVFKATFKFAIPENKWVEHCSVWGTTGKGKTTVIQALIADRLKDVRDNKCSLFIMDSQGSARGSLIHSISNLKEFAPGGELHGKLIYIDPRHPYAMNPFVHTTDTEEQRNQTAELLSFAFHEGGGEMSRQQKTLYRFCIRLLFEIPRANLSRFHELLTDGITPFFKPYVQRLPEAARKFFDGQFQDKNFRERAREVAARLAGVLENDSIATMFNAPECKLDFADKLSSSKVIVVSADKQYLAGDRCTLYGRMMIALLLRAVQTRASIAKDERMPTYCFIDEAHDYIADDPQITYIFDQARKMNVSMLCANQRTEQIRKNPVVLDALISTAIMFASTDNPGDEAIFAKKMRTTAEFIHGQPQPTNQGVYYALYVSGQNVVSVFVPFTLSKRDPMPHKEFDQILEEQWKEYGYHPEPKETPMLEAAEDDDPVPWK